MRQTSCQQLTLPSSGICTFIMFINMASLCFIRTFDAAFLCGRYTLKDLQKNLEIGWIAVLLQAFFCLYYKYFFTSNVSKTLHVHLQEESQALSYIFSVRYSFFWVHCCKHKGEKKIFRSPPNAGDRAENTMELYPFPYDIQTKNSRNKHPKTNFAGFLETKYFRSFNRSDLLCQYLNMFSQLKLKGHF